MTPPTMVTDEQVEEWRKFAVEEAALGAGSSGLGPEVVLDLIADRERYLGLLRGLLPAVDCPWEQDGTCTPENCMKEEARALLKEAGRDA